MSMSRDEPRRHAIRSVRISHSSLLRLGFARTKPVRSQHARPAAATQTRIEQLRDAASLENA